MTQAILTTASYLQSPIEALLDLFRRGIKAYKARVEIKRTLSELRSLSDRDLRDIGMTRGEIYSIACGATPTYSDNNNVNLKGWV